MDTTSAEMKNAFAFAKASTRNNDCYPFFSFFFNFFSAWFAAALT